MKIIPTLLLLALLLIHLQDISSQTWIQPECIGLLNETKDMQPIDFNAIRKAFYQCKDQRVWDEEALGTIEGKEDDALAQFRRWEWYNGPRVYPSGQFQTVSSILEEYTKLIRQESVGKSPTLRIQQNTANWTNLTLPNVPAGGATAGVGRVNCIAFMPGNPQTLFAGTACGGVWKSTNAGGQWSVLHTDLLPSLSITSIVIHPTDTNLIYIATGDCFTGFPISGVLKQGHFSAGIFSSSDGGLTWQLEGLPSTQADGFIPQQLIIDPVTPSTLLLAANTGVWRSLDGGANWTLVLNNNFFYSIEFNPLNHNVVYATSGQGLWRSNNNGVNWTYKGGGYPNQLGGRVTLGVTPADTNYIYLWGPVAGFKQSTNGGESFTTMASPSDIAQPYGYVDRAVGVSPTDPLVVFTGGIRAAKTTDGGTSWSASTNFDNINEPNWVHADIKKIIFKPGSGSTLYLANDGGVAVSTDTGVTWNDISTGLEIAEIYKLTNSPFSPDTIYFGAQDLGTFRWDAVLDTVKFLVGGDGFQPLVHPSDAMTIFASYQIGNLKKSIDGGINFFSASPGQYLWDPPLKMNPLNPNSMYAGCTAGVKKSINGGAQGSYINLSQGALNYIIAMDITKADTQYIYAASINTMIRSTDNGTNWTDITSGLPVDSAGITYITVSTVNPNRVYVTFSGYASTQKVYMTVDGGDTWINYSGSQLPNVPVNCITYIDGSHDEVYIGTDFGVFRRDADDSDWSGFNTGLPNVIVNHMEVQAGTRKLRVATYGRGMWESDLANQIPDTMIWNGSVSTLWNNPLNWTPHGVPIFSQNVIIPLVAAPGVYPIVNVTGLACKNITLHSQANMTIPTGMLLHTRGM